MIEKTPDLNGIETSLDPNSPLIPMLGGLVLATDMGNTAVAELKEAKQGLNEELDAVKQRWSIAIRVAEKNNTNAQYSINQRRSEIINLITAEGYNTGSVTPEDVIFAHGLINGPKADVGRCDSFVSFDFDRAAEELDLFRSLKPEEPIVHYIHSYGIYNLASGFITDNPRLELDPDDYLLDPIVTIPMTNNTEVKGAWSTLNRSIIVGHKEVDDFISGWAKANFIPKKSYNHPEAIFRILHELAGLQPLVIDNEKVQLIKQRVLAKVNDSIDWGTNWQIELPSRLRDISLVGGEDIFNEVASLVGPKLFTDELIKVFAKMLNPNFKELTPAEKYELMTKAAKLAEQYSEQ